MGIILYFSSQIRGRKQLQLLTTFLAVQPVRSLDSSYRRGCLPQDIAYIWAVATLVWYQQVHKADSPARCHRSRYIGLRGPANGSSHLASAVSKEESGHWPPVYDADIPKHIPASSN